jgi:hypothetical protein
MQQLIAQPLCLRFLPGQLLLNPPQLLLQSHLPVLGLLPPDRLLLLRLRTVPLPLRLLPLYPPVLEFNHLSLDGHLGLCSQRLDARFQDRKLFRLGVEGRSLTFGGGVGLGQMVAVGGVGIGESDDGRLEGG